MSVRSPLTIHSLEELISLLANPASDQVEAIAAALWEGELEAWLEARWEPQEQAQEIVKKLRTLQNRVGNRVDLACFALRELLNPGGPLPLRAGVVLSRPQDIEDVLRVAPQERQARLEALQRRIEDGYVEEWLCADDELQARRVLDLIKDSAQRYPAEGLLQAHVLR